MLEEFFSPNFSLIIGNMINWWIILKTQQWAAFQKYHTQFCRMKLLESSFYFFYNNHAGTLSGFLRTQLNFKLNSNNQ